MGALVIIDMQNAIRHPPWASEGPRNNRNAELAALRLIEEWRTKTWPIYHVKHDSVEPQSTYRPGQPGNAFLPGFEPLPDELVIAKHTGSAFTATPLEALLRARGQDALVIAGVITNNSVEATVRHAGTLGFDVTLAEDACFTFARRDWSGRLRTAQEVHDLSLANLDGEYCRVSTSAAILSGIGVVRPVLPYFDRPASHEPWDARGPAAAAYVGGLIDAHVEHIGSTAVPECSGKGVLDLLITYPEGALDAVTRGMFALGFQPQPGRDPFPPERPMLCGAIPHGASLWRIHAHVIADGNPEIALLLNFRDRLRAEDALRRQYIATKQAILASGITDGLDYAEAKSEFIVAAR